MARGRKPSSVSLDDKISKQKESLEKSKIKYEADKAELAELIKLRNNLRKEELMDAVIKSDKSYEEILAFLQKKETEE
mgnify:CR=1 FL=1